MPVRPTYPGIYIEELPSSARTITAAPTSITVFVGYTHPFKTKPENWGKPIQLFNFTEYQREFGGFFENTIFNAESGNFGSVAHAVNQFFINGGSIAYVVGIQPRGTSGGGNPTVITPGGADFGGITITSREPTDTNYQMRVIINNRKPSDANTPLVLDLADITVTYGQGSGSQAEIFRQVSLKKLEGTKPNPNFIETRIGTSAQPVSSLITVSKTSANYPTSLSADFDQTLSQSPANGSTIFSVGDYTSIFQNDQPLDKLSIFNVLVIPGVTNNAILSVATAFCENKQAFFIMDAPNNKTASPGTQWVGDYITTVPLSRNSALYFPYLKSLHPLTGQPIDLPPSGFVAGIYASTDLKRGVWKAPAGLETTLRGTLGVVESGVMTDLRQGTLNPIAVNCLRSFPGAGTVVYGARTVVGSDSNTAFQQWKYVPVRRMTLFIEQTLYRNLGWVVFEPNDEPLWVAIRISIENFMLSLFNQGAFQGSKPSQAFQVKCDSSTTTQTDIDNGIVNIIVAFAPLKPAEFVIVKIAQLSGQVQS